jgi:hypothetical protein
MPTFRNAWIYTSTPPISAGCGVYLNILDGVAFTVLGYPQSSFNIFSLFYVFLHLLEEKQPFLLIFNIFSIRFCSHQRQLAFFCCFILLPYIRKFKTVASVRPFLIYRRSSSIKLKVPPPPPQPLYYCLACHRCTRDGWVTAALYSEFPQIVFLGAFLCVGIFC